MGGVLSKGKAAASARTDSADALQVESHSKAAHDARTSTAEPENTNDESRPDYTDEIASSSHEQANDMPAGELPPDMQFILQSGLHEEPADDREAAKGVQQGSIQDAVNDIKAKYNINQPVASGELERIRKEIELKTRLMEMREAQQRRRMAATEASTNAHTTAKTQEAAIYKVDWKGKGRATEDADESSGSENEEASSSDDSDSDSGSSSSSSGSSIGLKKNNKSKKPTNNVEDDDFEEDGSDDGFSAGKLKPEEIAQAAAAFASQHEVVNPTIPPPPVDTIPADAPLRPIGKIDHVINSVIVIRADMNTQESMKGQILDEGSLLCLGDRRVLGAIFETFGSIHSPFYSIRLPPDHQLVVKTTTSDGSESEPVRSGMQVFYSPTPDFSGLLYTRDIRQSQMKGSDASNLYDEEVGENEIEFSDDEQEVAYRRDLKQRKKDRWTERQQGASADNAEFEFDEDFDDTASVRSAANLPYEAAQPLESEEEGAITEVSASHKRRLSSSMGSTQGGDAKVSRVESSSGAHRGRGQRPERGRGRGRGAHSANGQNRGRGAGRGGSERGRGRGNNRGAPRGGSEHRVGMTQGRPLMSNTLPPRPAYQHPDALPYDDISPPLFQQQQRSMSPVRPQHVLPPRPSAVVEPYDPSTPHQPPSFAPPRGMNALAQPWSPQSSAYGTADHVPYVPSAPFPIQSNSQQYSPTTFGNGSFPFSSAYQPHTAQYQQGGFVGTPAPFPNNQYGYPSGAFGAPGRRDHDSAGK